ncbi:phospho-N-acetylmuramoyl-pentapeptide-transferase [Candidatus Falkowbacteria bacterium]|jgi:phospho-N-acetylmuramoyl-pentapeptide-transferase|nr:phospho-N-acetylmuramoyl-pentapeptide-transferase [Patescibacteria group bacterium]MDD3434943.1 phospho-N-acetylmuramoyl-pentapeptide-transferase [Patescibacteria group bacterium]MDD4466368.1 phospho-N-acetylmuramoyl-pentapeptide-transferase [Patescibacteria group bacterium]NCU43086.1 phospho-N-acetylmuramoyl-pentapeptide-transferase [Candidatus Falkowbacteria bacterium]
MDYFYIIKILLLAMSSFLFAGFMTPLLTNFLYKHKLGKKIRNSGETPIFSKLHAAKEGTPTMGGVLIWGTVLVFILGLYVAAQIFDYEIIRNLNFLTRSETLLPLGALVASALIGLVDDWLDVRGKGVLGGGGLKMRHRLLIYTAIALIGALWFYFKLDWTVFHIPFVGNLEISWWYIPAFVLIVVATAFSVNETDGLDGLAGGTLLVAFAAYAAIAFLLGRYELATFCAVIIGALMAFLWYNIPPARFYMGDTGSMSLGITLAIIALLTNSALLLLFIGFIFLIESLSVIIQLTSKKLRRGKKVFLSAPIHHHFQAIGWPESKIVMRFWLVSGAMALLGVIIFLADRGL